MNLEKITQQITALTRNVGEWILNESGNLQEKDIEVKGKHNYVTYVDKTSEEMIVTGLKKIIHVILNSPGLLIPWMAQPISSIKSRFTPLA